MRTKDIISFTAQIDSESTVISTGQRPQDERDLLVIGEPLRDDFFDEINRHANSECIRSDDALVFDDDIERIGMAYHNNESFLKLADDIAKGRNTDPIVKHWALGPWLPETFASDLSRAVVLRQGRQNIVDGIRSFDKYPEVMRQAIIQRCLAEISIKLNFIDSSDDIQPHLAYSTQFTDICIAGLRLVYANESLYFRGLKYEPITKHGLSERGQAISRSFVEYKDIITVCKLLIA